MAIHRTRLDRNGRIVIPAAVREQLGVKPGDELVLDVGPHDVRLTSHSAALTELKRLVREGTGKHPYTVEEFLKDRRAEADLEEHVWHRRRKSRG